MSIFYCFVCDRHIDSDYDAEHLESCPDEEEEQDQDIDAGIEDGHGPQFGDN